jgi:predicted PurR-regulated permease PerM
MNGRAQLRFWVGGFILTLVAIYFLRDVLLPFLIGMAVAYLLDPLVDRMQKIGVRRSVASATIIIGFFAVVVLVFVLLYPMLQSQVMALIDRLPTAIAALQRLVQPAIDQLLRGLEPGGTGDIGATVAKIGETGVGIATGLINRVWSGGLALVNLASVVLITPVVAFYLLRDWDAIVERIDSWLPRAHVSTIRTQMALVDKALAGFVRGQTLVCLISGSMYAIGWTLVGLDFGLVIGLVTGILSFIPYVGAFIGITIAMIIGIGQFWPDYVQLGLVLGVYLAMQTIEGTFIAPRLVGRNVGLHDLWIIFALFAGGSLFGFVGVLLAVPTAAALGVILRFALSRYLASPYYLGRPPNDVPG